MLPVYVLVLLCVSVALFKKHTLGASLIIYSALVLASTNVGFLIFSCSDLPRDFHVMPIHDFVLYGQ